MKGKDNDYKYRDTSTTTGEEIMLKEKTMKKKVKTPVDPMLTWAKKRHITKSKISGKGFKFLDKKLPTEDASFAPKGAEVTYWNKKGKPHTITIKTSKFHHRQLFDIYSACDTHGVKAEVIKSPDDKGLLLVWTKK